MVFGCKEFSVNSSYTELIASLIADAPFDIDTEIEIKGRIPTLASSEFLTNKEQGDWAESVIHDAINEYSLEFRAVKYGRGESLAAGDPGFAEFYSDYRDELNAIGKKPDILIFRRDDIVDGQIADLDDVGLVCKAVAAIEVRSSSFLSSKYAEFMETRIRRAESECERIQQLILQAPYSEALAEKRPALYRMIEGASFDTFRELSFKVPGWRTSQTLRELNGYLKDLKAQMKVLQTRDYLSITPKLEDIALVNRWIQRFGVPHYYLQVFFDKAYIISFEDILRITSDPKNEDVVFSVEHNVKNQGKTTIHMNVQVGKEILRRVDMPMHRSALKELERGRLLFYVTFQGGKGYIDSEIFSQEIINDS